MSLFLTSILSHVHLLKWSKLCMENQPFLWINDVNEVNFVGKHKLLVCFVTSIPFCVHTLKWSKLYRDNLIVHFSPQSFLVFIDWDEIISDLSVGASSIIEFGLVNGGLFLGGNNFWRRKIFKLHVDCRVSLCRGSWWWGTNQKRIYLF